MNALCSYFSLANSLLSLYKNILSNTINGKSTTTVCMSRFLSASSDAASCTYKKALTCVRVLISPLLESGKGRDTFLSRQELAALWSEVS